MYGVFPFKRIVLAGMMVASMTSFSHALTIGQIKVQSQTNQPFRAVASVDGVQQPLNGIMLADRDAYSQLGLTRTPLQVSYVADSPTQGRLIITSNSPIESPYVDMVLSLTDQSGTQVIPKTALVPITTSSQATPIEIQPTINAMPAGQAIAKGRLPRVSPLPIQSGMPPLIEAESDSLPPLSTPVTQSSGNTQITTNQSDDSDNIVIRERRIVTPVGQAPTAALEAQSLALTPPTIDINTTEPPPVVTQTNPPNRTEGSLDTQLPTVYQVQPNDTLWEVAKRIADANNLTIKQVMDGIQANNKKAFIGNNPNLLKANAQLTIPVREEIRELAAQYRQQVAKSRQSIPTKSKPKSKPKKAASAQKRPATQAPKRTKKAEVNNIKTKRQKLPTPKMSLVAPETDGSGQGDTKLNTQAKPNFPPQILDKLKIQRGITAQKAAKVNKLNTLMLNLDKKIKIQNAKLAELEQRLKKAK